jgi:hypothetical protein
MSSKGTNFPILRILFAQLKSSQVKIAVLDMPEDGRPGGPRIDQHNSSWPFALDILLDVFYKVASNGPPLLRVYLHFALQKRRNSQFVAKARTRSGLQKEYETVL